MMRNRIKFNKMMENHKISDHHNYHQTVAILPITQVLESDLHLLLKYYISVVPRAEQVKTS